MGMRRVLVPVVSAFCIAAISHSAAGATVGKPSQNDFGESSIRVMSRAVVSTTNSESVRDVSVDDELPDDHPVGSGAIVTPVSVERANNRNDVALSTFLVDYPPGASAVLHRLPSSGYVLVHVLSGTIRALAWHAGVGVYHTGETWVEPAFAYSIATANSSARQSARALVVVVAQDPRTQTGQPTPVE